MTSDSDTPSSSQRLEQKISSSAWTEEGWALLEGCDPRMKRMPPASDAEIQRLNEFVQGELPEDLDSFLEEANGLTFNGDFIIYPIELIIQITNDMRELDCIFPNEHLLFIGGMGDGSEFAFGKTKEGEWSNWIFRWEHEADSLVDFGLGIWGYLSKQVPLCLAEAEDPPDSDTEAQYKERLIKLSGSSDVNEAINSLVRRILDLRAKQQVCDFPAQDIKIENQRKMEHLELLCEESSVQNVLTEYLNQLSVDDFRKLPIERLMAEVD